MLNRQNAPIAEGYIAGIGALLVVACWVKLNAFHPLWTLALYAIGWYCIFQSTLWLIARELSIRAWFIKSPVRFYTVGFFACLMIVGYFDLFFLFDVDQGRYNFGDKWDNIIVESHGLLFDLFILGILLSVYDHYREYIRKKEEKEQIIKRYCEELDDFRQWRSDEAKYRIMGIIKRLNEEGYTAIDLKYVDLTKIVVDLPRVQLISAKLLETYFSTANLMHANFSEATLYSSKFLSRNTRLHNAKFINAKLYAVDFSEAFLVDVDFTGAELSKCKFYKADLRGLILQNAILSQTEFSGAEVHQDFFDKLANWNIQGQAIQEEYDLIRQEVPNLPGEFKYILQKKS